MKVLGVDPGTLATGWCIVEAFPGGRLVAHAHGVVRTRAADPLWDRLAQIHRAIDAIAETHGPSALALEQCFVAKNVQSALKLGHTRGVVMIAAKAHGAEVFEYAPSQVKSAVTGNGRAEKHQVAEMVRILLGLSETAPADASDALAVAICHIHGRTRRILEVVAAGRR
jgi:crossover junction endodeoxyribonuclease RuvC